jgi:hypothetical protein
LFDEEMKMPKPDTGVFHVSDRNRKPVFESRSLKATIEWLRTVEATQYQVAYAYEISADTLRGDRFLMKFEKVVKDV